MIKFYPYLSTPFGQTLNEQQKKSDYLSKVGQYVNQRQYIKMTLLDWDENPLKEIEGEVSSGSLTKDGTSSVRRTASLQIGVDGGSYSVDDLDMDFAINKKIFIELGIENKTGEYEEYPVLWFPQGVFFIQSFSMTSSASSSVSISLSLRDKMSVLNGDVGGTIPATTVFDTVDTQLPSGEYASQKVLIFNIIKEMVNHFGGEDLNRIVIEDVPLQIKRVMRWIGDSPLYLVGHGNLSDTSNHSYVADTEKPSEGEYQMYSVGDDVGYVYDDFIYTGELEAGAGDTVTTILDKIVQYLGNYEYFYDEYGVFHFREIKNYMNTTLATIAIGDMSKNDYMCNTTISKFLYSFDDSSNIISITNSPQYENIKNDYIVEGLRKSTIEDISYPIRYHLAIDKKPKKTYQETESSEYTYEPRKDFVIYIDESDGLKKGAFLTVVKDLPEVGNFNLVYYCEGDVVYWDAALLEYKKVDVVALYVGKDKKYIPKDWRTELYVRGLKAKTIGIDQGRYFAELEAGWPTIYDIEHQSFYTEQKTDDADVSQASLADGNFYLDFIDPSTTNLGQYSIDSIGCRSDIVVDEEVNCLFQPKIPNVVYVDISDKENSQKTIEWLLQKGEPYSQVRPSIYANLATGGYKNGAYDRIKYELYLHTNFQRSISITAVPLYYLEPNTRIRVNESTTNVRGDFVVNNITIPFGPNATMTVSASETFERF